MAIHSTIDEEFLGENERFLMQRYQNVIETRLFKSL